jgi:hypothetical protein
MALGLSGLGVVALTGPALGGVLAAALWLARHLAGRTLYGAAALVFVWRGCRRRCASATRRHPPKPWLQRGWADIARHPTFRAWALLMACTYGGLFTCLAGSSFVYMDVLGLLARLAYGLAMAWLGVLHPGHLRLPPGGSTRMGHGRRGAAWRVASRAAALTAGGLAAAGTAELRVGAAGAACWCRLRPRHPPTLRAGGRGRAVPGQAGHGVGAGRASRCRLWPSASAPGWAVALDGRSPPDPADAGASGPLTACGGLDPGAAPGMAGAAARPGAPAHFMPPTPCGLVGPTASGKTAWPCALAERLAAAPGDHQRRLRAGLPRHGHRHGQAERRPSAPPCRTTAST